MSARLGPPSIRRLTAARGNLFRLNQNIAPAV
jgi:hypothetical protein